MELNPFGTLSDAKQAVFYVPSVSYGFLYARPTTELHQIVAFRIGSWGFHPFSREILGTLAVIGLIGGMLFHGINQLIFGREKLSKDSDMAIQHTFGLILNIAPSEIPTLPNNYRSMFMTEEGRETLVDMFELFIGRPVRLLFWGFFAGGTYVSAWIAFVPMYVVFDAGGGNYLAGLFMFGLAILLIQPKVLGLYPITYISPEAASRIDIPEYKHAHGKLPSKSNNRPRIDTNRRKKGKMR